MAQRGATFNQMPEDGMEPGQQLQPETTGRLLVLLNADDQDSAERTLKDRAGVSSLDDKEHQYCPELGIAVINADVEQQGRIQELEGSGSILATEAEQVVGVSPMMGVQAVETSSTWGLHATKVISSSHSGAGIKVAILDTGFDFSHPDFKDRFTNQDKQGQSFVKGEGVQDGHGHGTHCTGTACGPKNPMNSDIRYGVAYESEIYIGKVLGNQGTGADGSIIAGIEWAVKEGCHIISMSLGVLTGRNIAYSNIYEVVAQRALSRGTLIIAAAGNNSHRNLRPALINPVNRPADSPSIMAVGAIDSSLQIGWFSNGGTNASEQDKSGAVDIAAPGVNIYSSWPVNKGSYNSINGTSMATPHVAGVAALYAQATGKRGQDLWNLLISGNCVESIALPERDVGRGLIQAP